MRYLTATCDECHEIVTHAERPDGAPAIRMNQDRVEVAPPPICRPCGHTSGYTVVVHDTRSKGF